MPSPDPKPKITIRAASREDLPILRELLSARDDEQRHDAAVRDHLMDCDPERFLAWIAFDGDEPVGLTALYLRPLRFDGDEPVDRTAGYWAHLYVRESHRSLMVYPQLVFAMSRGMREAGLDLLFTATRQPDVAEGHQKLGYQLVGTIPVRLLPLRPFRLVARQKKLGALAEALSPAGDCLWSLWRRLSWRTTGDERTIEQVELDDDRIEGLVELMNRRGAGRIAQTWTPELFRARFRGALDGEPYGIHLACDGKRVLGGTIHRLAIRGNGVRTGVILDLVLSEGHEDLAAPLLASLERRMRLDGADVVLHLDGVPDGSGAAVRARGYRTAPDIYHLLVNPKALVAPGTPDGDLDNWLFAFSDHDAF